MPVSVALLKLTENLCWHLHRIDIKLRMQLNLNSEPDTCPKNKFTNNQQHTHTEQKHTQ